MQYIIGVDLGGTFIKSAILTVEGTVIATSTLKTEENRVPEIVIPSMADDILQALASNKIAKEDVLGIGIGSPGILSNDSGIVYYSPNFPLWRDVPLREKLSGLTGLPVCLNNDANCAAYGEFWKGVGRGVQTMILLTLGTGVGGGIIINGRLYIGIDGGAGELGHVTVALDGPVCGCGNMGCLESLASATAILDRAATRIKAGTPTLLRKAYEEGVLNGLAIYEAAQLGDDLSIELFNEMGRYLGIAAAGLINTLNPELIVVGGGISGAGDFILEPMRQEIRRRARLAKLADRAKIVRARLGNEAGFIGAAGLMLAELKEKS